MHLRFGLREGQLFDDIHQALADGKRGVVPANATRIAKLEADVSRLTEALRVVMDENKMLTGQLTEARQQRDQDRESMRRELREAYEEIGRLKAGKKAE